MGIEKLEVTIGMVVDKKEKKLFKTYVE